MKIRVQGPRASAYNPSIQEAEASWEVEVLPHSLPWNLPATLKMARTHLQKFLNDFTLVSCCFQNISPGKSHNKTNETPDQINRHISQSNKDNLRLYASSQRASKILDYWQLPRNKDPHRKHQASREKSSPKEPLCTVVGNRGSYGTMHI